MPICAFDVYEDGRAMAVNDSDLLGKADYRWWHFDLSDPALPDFLSQLPDIPERALRQAETRPRCDHYGDGIIMNLRGINMNEGQSEDDMVSLRLWMTSNLIVTVRMRRVFAVDDLRRACDENKAPATVGSFLFSLIEGLTSRVERTVLRTSEEADALEDDILEGSSVAPDAIGVLRRRTVRLMRYVAPQRDALSGLLALNTPILTEIDRLHLREPTNRTMLAIEALHASRERLVSLQDHIDALQNVRMGQNGYVLSIVAAIFLPISFITGLFGVNIAGMPGLENPMAFSILSLSMVAVAVFLVLLFRLLKWL